MPREHIEWCRHETLPAYPEYAGQEVSCEDCLQRFVAVEFYKNKLSWDAIEEVDEECQQQNESEL